MLCGCCCPWGQRLGVGEWLTPRDRKAYQHDPALKTKSFSFVRRPSLCSMPGPSLVPVLFQKLPPALKSGYPAMSPPHQAVLELFSLKFAWAFKNFLITKLSCSIWILYASSCLPWAPSVALPVVTLELFAWLPSILVSLASSLQQPTYYTYKHNHARTQNTGNPWINRQCLLFLF